MARRKLSEYKAKEIVFKAFNLPFTSKQLTAQLDSNKITTSLPPERTYVLKIDQGIKGRMKKGLVSIKLTPTQLKKKVQEYQKLGYSQFIIEEYDEHQSTEEQYISLERTRDGIVALYSVHGGIEIESKQQTIGSLLLNENTFKTLQENFTLSIDRIKTLYAVFQENYFSFLEINPFIIKNNQLKILDLAVEVDDAAEFFTNGNWTSNDFVTGDLKPKLKEEAVVQQLVKTSQASFRLDVFNENGSIFMLLSGGGASLVMADEVYNLGFGKKLALYGEYSGNPNSEETYIYTKQILSLLSQSKATKKVLIIGGGVANFTDVRVTFSGIIKAIDEVKKNLVTQKIKIYVRRGGPHQGEGLALMKEFLEKNQLYGYVTGPNVMLTEIINKAINLK